MNGQAISDAVSGLGWRYILGTLRTSVSVRSLAEAADVAVRVAAAARDWAGQLALDLRPDRLVLTVHPAAGASMTADDVGLARRLSDVVITGGLRTDPGGGDDRSRSVQLLADDRAPAFWILADAEGNEACVTTWQGRDS